MKTSIQNDHHLASKLGPRLLKTLHTQGLFAFTASPVRCTFASALPSSSQAIHFRYLSIPNLTAISTVCSESMVLLTCDCSLLSPREIEIRMSALVARIWGPPLVYAEWNVGRRPPARQSVFRERGVGWCRADLELTDAYGLAPGQCAPRLAVPAAAATDEETHEIGDKAWVDGDGDDGAKATRVMVQPSEDRGRAEQDYRDG